MNQKDYDFDEMLEGASSIVDEDAQDTSTIDEVSSIYKLDDVLLNEGWDYDANGIYIHFKPTFQSIGVEDIDDFTTKDNIYLWVSRDFETRKKILLKFKWAIKTSDEYSLARGFTFDDSLDIGDEKILKDLNKKVSFSGGKNGNPASKDTYVSFVDYFTSKIIDSPQLEVFKNEDYDAPDFEDEEVPESESSDVVQCFDDYPEDIKHEAKKIINDGSLFNEIQKSVSLTHQGHERTRDALILCESSLFVGEGIHVFLGGESGEGKSDLAFGVGYNFPTHYVKILRNISPKNIYYDCKSYNDNFNILIFDDLPLNEDMIHILKELSDNTKKVKELKTVINGKSETFTLEGKFVVILTYAQELTDVELKNRLFNLGVTIIDKTSEGKTRVKSKIRDNSVTGGNENPIIERNRLIIQASIHYLIEQDMNVFNPFLSIFNPNEYNNRDVNHLSNMVKAKTFFEYSERNQIKIKEDFTITLGAYDDFEFASLIWAKDSDAQKYKLTEKQKKVLNILPEMTQEEAYDKVDKVKKEIDNAQSRGAQAKILSKLFTKNRIHVETGINTSTLTNVLDRVNHGTSQSLSEMGKVGKIKLDENVRNSQNIYYKIKKEGESSKSDESIMLDMYSQFTKLNTNPYCKMKILIDLLYYVNIVINEKGYMYLKNYCEDYPEDIDVKSYDSMFEFIESFFEGFNYDDYSVDVNDASYDELNEMNNYKIEIDEGFEKNSRIHMSSPNDKENTQHINQEENHSLANPSEDVICKSQIHDKTKVKSKIQALLKEKRINVDVGYSILNVLSEDDGLTKYEIQNKMYPNPNPDDVDERLILAIDTNLQKLVDKGFVTIKTSYGMLYHLEEDTKKLFEGDDD